MRAVRLVREVFDQDVVTWSGAPTRWRSVDAPGRSSSRCCTSRRGRIGPALLDELGLDGVSLDAITDVRAAPRREPRGGRLERRSSRPSARSRRIHPLRSSRVGGRCTSRAWVPARWEVMRSRPPRGTATRAARVARREQRPGGRGHRRRLRPHVARGLHVRPARADRPPDRRDQARRPSARWCRTWLAALPADGVILDLACDPYDLDVDPPVVKGIEGVPHGSLDRYVFPPWTRRTSDRLRGSTRRTGGSRCPATRGRARPRREHGGRTASSSSRC